jgi:hypothetical protein
VASGFYPYGEISTLWAARSIYLNVFNILASTLPAPLDRAEERPRSMANGLLSIKAPPYFGKIYFRPPRGAPGISRMRFGRRIALMRSAPMP